MRKINVFDPDSYRALAQKLNEKIQITTCKNKNERSIESQDDYKISSKDKIFEELWGRNYNIFDAINIIKKVKYVIP